MEIKAGHIRWYRGLQLDGLVGYLAAGNPCQPTSFAAVHGKCVPKHRTVVINFWLSRVGYGEVRLAAYDLHLCQEDDGQRWQWFKPLDPRPAGPAEALVHWLQVCSNRGLDSANASQVQRFA